MPLFLAAALFMPPALAGIDRGFEPMVAGAMYAYDARQTPAGGAERPFARVVVKIGQPWAQPAALRWNVKTRFSFADAGRKPYEHDVDYEWRADGFWEFDENGVGDRQLPARPRLGERWSDARSTREVIATDAVVEVPAGKYAGCLRIRQTMKADGATSEIAYAHGVGVVHQLERDADGTAWVTRLVRYTTP